MKGQKKIKKENNTWKLLAAPIAYADESPASWIQSVCASHQYSMTRIEEIFDVKPRFHDWDFDLSPISWLDIFKKTNSCQDTFSQTFLSTEYSSHVSMGRSLNSVLNRPPTYRWCTACLQEDDRPYLRWWWRLSNRSHCPKHDTRLRSICANCQSKLVLSYALMVNAGRRSAIPDLSHCQGCGLPRSFSESIEIFDEHIKNDDQINSLSHQNEAISGGCNNIFDNKKSVPTSVWGKDKFLIDDFSIGVGFLRRWKPPVLSINAKVFQDEPNTNMVVKSDKWSLRIAKSRVTTRLKLAYAVRLIRAEKKSNRVIDET